MENKIKEKINKINTIVGYAAMANIEKKAKWITDELHRFNEAVIEQLEKNFSRNQTTEDWCQQASTQFDRIKAAILAQCISDKLRVPSRIEANKVYYEVDGQIIEGQRDASTYALYQLITHQLGFDITVFPKHEYCVLLGVTPDKELGLRFPDLTMEEQEKAAWLIKDCNLEDPAAAAYVIIRHLDDVNIADLPHYKRAKECLRLLDEIIEHKHNPADVAKIVDELLAL